MFIKNVFQTKVVWSKGEQIIVKLIFEKINFSRLSPFFKWNYM